MHESDVKKWRLCPAEWTNVGRAAREPRGRYMPRVDRLDAFTDPRRLSEKIK